MITHYIEHDGKIVLYDTSIEKLQRTLRLMPQYKNDEIKSTERPIEEFQFADTEEYINKKAEQAKQTQIAELVAQLDAIDLKTVRPLRAIQAADFTDEDVAKLAELETQAQAIRQQIQELKGE